MTVADRIGVMNQGRLIQVATPPEIYEQPELALGRGLHRRREFDLGPCRRCRRRIDGGRERIWPAAANCPPQWKPSQAIVWVALRPEKVRIALGAAVRRRETACAGEVENIGYLGDLSIYSGASRRRLRV